MKRLLWSSLLLCLWTGCIFFSCSDGGAEKKKVAGTEADTAGKIVPASGGTVESHQTNRENPGKDTVLRYKTEIRNNGPDQKRIDSIKDAKTKKKK
jgi:hypothetical protein